MNAREERRRQTVRREKLPKLSVPLMFISSQKRWRLNEGGENYCQLEERGGRVVNRGLKKQREAYYTISQSTYLNMKLLQFLFSHSRLTSSSLLPSFWWFSLLSCPEDVGRVPTEKHRESVFVGLTGESVNSTSNPPWRDWDHQICIWPPEYLYGFSRCELCTEPLAALIHLNALSRWDVEIGCTLTSINPLALIDIRKAVARMVSYPYFTSTYSTNIHFTSIGFKLRHSCSRWENSEHPS